MKIWKCVALIAVLALLFRGLVALGADAVLDNLLRTAIGDEALVEGTLLRQSSWLSVTAAEAREPLSDTAAEDISYEPHDTEPPPALVLREGLPIYRASRAERLPTMTFRGNESQPNLEGIYLRNNTTYAVNIEELLTTPLSFDPAAGGSPTVLILHTHGTESFEPEGDDWYDNVDNYRTNDMNLNITRVGREVAAIFEARGIRVIHSQEIHDYPSFRGSYGRSLAAAQRYLARYPEIQIVLDLHRDAIMDSAGNYIRTLADIEGVTSAQVMLVVGTDHAGLEHPHWRENLKFALRLQAAMVAHHPTFARPMSLREERFNAHLAPGAVLVEIGTCANTLQEALTAGRIFAEIAADVILGV